MRNFTILVCLIVVTPCFSQIADGDTIDFKEFSNSSLIAAFKYLNRTYEINFSYNPDAIDSIIVPIVPASVNTVEKFLNLSLNGSSISFELISNTYVLFPKQPKNQKEKNKKNILSGIVVDKDTQESLPYASVWIPQSKINSSSNSDGKFTLMYIPSDTSMVQINYLGYVPLMIPLKNVDFNKVLICQMIRKQRNLPSVQIVGKNQELVEINANPSQFTFNPDQISNLPNLGENDVFSALRRLPGIRGGLDASSGLKIRGGASDHNLVLFDGITVYHVDHFYGFLSAFNTNVIKNIQVDKGAYSAKYGGRASGIVNITGIDGNKIKPSVLVEATTLSANVRAELPIVPNKASVVFAYRRSFTDIIQSPTYKNLFNNIFNSSIPTAGNNTIDVFGGSQEPDYSFSDLNAKLNFIPSDKDAISLSYYQAKDDVAIRFDGSQQNLTRSALDNTDWGTKGGSLKWSRKWNKRFFTYANYGISRYTSNLDAEDSYFFGESDTLFSQIFYMQRNRVNDNSFRLDNSWDLNSRTKLEFGYWNSGYEIELQAQNQNRIIQDSTMDASLNAIYLEVERQLGKWNLSVGFRASAYSETKNILLEPRVSFSYPFSSNFQIKGAYGIFHQIIRRLNERSLYLSIPETWTLSGDNTVPILRSSHYVLGFLHAKNDWQFDVEGYHKYETGIVDFLFPEFGFATGDISQFNIGGKSKVFGLDALLKRSFQNQNILVSYTFLNSESMYSEVNGGEYFTSSGSSAHELNLVYSYEWKRWDFSVAFVLASGVPYTPVLGTFVVTLPNGEEQQFVSIGSLNSERLNWYHRVDLGLNYSILLKNGSLQMGASVYNVYNNLGIKFIDYYQIPNENDNFYSLGQRDILSLGFTPSLFLKFKI